MKLKYFLAASVVSLSAAMILPAPVAAQQITTGIQGSVLDEDGNPVSGATVTVTDTRTGTQRTMATGSGGSFSATNLVTGGPYTVSANAGGFEGQSISGVYTTLQGATDLTFTLASGAGEIVVTAARVGVTQLAVGPGQSFTSEVLADAPTFNRDVRDVIRLDPRVSLDRDDGGSGQDRISCLGGNDRGNAFTVDGISQGDIYGLNDTGFSSRSSTPIPYDAVRETQVQFAPFDVDYGQFTGCAINVVTKSGTNEYHFGGFFEYTDDGLRGNTVAGIQVAPVEPEKRWGVHLGGPIIKDICGCTVPMNIKKPASRRIKASPAPASRLRSLRSLWINSTRSPTCCAGLRHRHRPLVYQPSVQERPLFHPRRPSDQRSPPARGDLSAARGIDHQGRRSGFTGTSGGTVVGENTFYLSGTKSNYYSGRLYSDWTDNFSTEIALFPLGSAGSAGSDRRRRSAVRQSDPRIIVGIHNGPDAADDGAVEVGPGYSRTANDLRTKLDQWRFVAKLDLGPSL